VALPPTIGLPGVEARTKMFTRPPFRSLSAFVRVTVDCGKAGTAGYVVLHHVDHQTVHGHD
jgi:hypothetical protein